ncbi:hypothetical protein BJX96DRAFT_61035 [Aspergillus floccosus]
MTKLFCFLLHLYRAVLFPSGSLPIGGLFNLSSFSSVIFRRIHLDGGLPVIEEDDPGRSGLKYMMNDPSGLASSAEASSDAIFTTLLELIIIAILL